MDITKTFATNKGKEDEGVWVKGPEGAEFLIARQGNKAFTKLAGHLTKPYRKLIEMGKADEKIVTEITAEVVARTVLLDWRGVSEAGKPLPYSTETAKRLLLAMPDFADLVGGYSRSIALYQDDEDKAAAGN